MSSLKCPVCGGSPRGTSEWTTGVHSSVEGTVYDDPETVLHPDSGAAVLVCANVGSHLYALVNGRAVRVSVEIDPVVTPYKG